MDESKSIAARISNRFLSGTKARRFGCFVLILIWFVLLLLPCFLIMLATQSEISIQVGNVPGQVIRIWLIEGAKERGIAISRPSIVLNAVTNATCVQTDTSFLLWMGRGEATQFCDCYKQVTDTWTLIGSHSGICMP